MKSRSSEKAILSILAILVLIVSVIGVSFAFFTYTKEGSLENSIHSGTLILNFNEQQNGIILQNALPIPDDVAITNTTQGSYFDFSVDYTIVGNTSLTYEIDIVDITESSVSYINGLEKLDSINLKVALLDSNDKTVIVGPSYFSDILKIASTNNKEGYKLYEKIVTTTGVDNYRLYMWIPELDANGNQVMMMDILSETETNEDGSKLVIQKGINNQTFSVKINLQAIDTMSLVNGN